MRNRKNFPPINFTGLSSNTTEREKQLNCKHNNTSEWRYSSVTLDETCECLNCQKLFHRNYQ
jgi:hypothetical protein